MKKINFLETFCLKVILKHGFSNQYKNAFKIFSLFKSAIILVTHFCLPVSGKPTEVRSVDIGLISLMLLCLSLLLWNGDTASKPDPC